MMISVETALECIHKHATRLQASEVIATNDALGRTLSQDIMAPLSLPPFKQSIMDGYALCVGQSQTYKVIGEIKTGDTATQVLQPGEALRVFTGAQLPDTANAVVMQEHVTANGNTIDLKDSPKEGQHIRNIGEQIAEGTRSLTKGETLNPSAVGVLKSFGLKTISVYKQPKVSVIVTGNELVSVGTPLQPGQIYESNSQVMVSALQQKGIATEAVITVKDNLKDTEDAIKQALDTSDIVLISGGISVGDYDFVGTALHNLGVHQVFHKVLQKPGKPLYFGTTDSKYVFALPGNPAATLTCLYVYVYALIDSITGNQTVGLTRIQFPISEDFENPFGRALFLKAKLKGAEVEILNQQNSAMLLSFARADALVYIPSDCKSVKKGHLVTTVLMPSGV
ncbi:gephyrin-like molybdotransferase Glp [Sediminibacter sp. Hel_I_10]|uniref:molybdopterin molybdotransferase MoeA n=1 Tax=Sediminibacter sp. Hel_I_10 TaxID=1392490 RepID=UPI0018CC0C15|nr:gephyrin-like molybdotransferase Glp [Sediminibacter sp. Hel_I_10]